MSPAVEDWEGRPPTDWAETWGLPVLEVHDRIGSTNDRALGLLQDGCDPFTVVLAGEQTEGRGRRGASWHSAPGSGIWMSIVVPEPGPATHVTLVVGLAVAEGIEAAAPDIRIGLEWPNDLVTARGKVGGILCESAPGGLVAGVGINLRAPEGGFPAALAGRATALEVAKAKPLSRPDIVACILVRLKARLGDPTGAELTPETLGALSARDVLLDTLVQTEEHGQGTARGVAPDGALLLERPDGSRVPVRAGSVRRV